MHEDAVLQTEALALLVLGQTGDVLADGRSGGLVLGDCAHLLVHIINIVILVFSQVWPFIMVLFITRRHI